MHVEDKGLKALLPYGIGFHNASLSSADRSAVEQLFMNTDLLVQSGCCLCNTLRHTYVSHAMFKNVMHVCPEWSPWKIPGQKSS